MASCDGKSWCWIRGKVEDWLGTVEVSLGNAGDEFHSLKYRRHDMAMLPSCSSVFVLGTVRGLEIRASLGDRIELEPLVEVDLQLSHGLLRLGHGHHVDAPVA